MARRRPAACVLALVAGGLAACAGAPPVRPFPDRPVAWLEGDDAGITVTPALQPLQDMDVTYIVRDSIDGEIARALALETATPARDVNALDEVPCSTWFCPRHHRAPLTAAQIAAGPPADVPARLPLRIVKGKARGAALGYQVVDADGRKYQLKLDPAGHVGLATAPEIVGTRLFHALGYNVPGAHTVDLGPEDLVVDAKATYSPHEGTKLPLTAARVAEQMRAAARGPGGKWRGVACSWIRGTIIGAFDMKGRRADDPNDLIPHEHRRSLRASRVLFAWLGVLDASAFNTLDSVVEEDGRRFVRHHFIDFGAGFGSATTRPKGPAEGGERIVEVGRTLGAFLSFGAYQRPWQDEEDDWGAAVAAWPALGAFSADGFDPESFRTLRKVPAHARMTARDAYWGAKLVTSFDDGALAAAIGPAALPPAEAARLLAVLAARRDVVGRRYLLAETALEAPRLHHGATTSLCFDDLAVTRGYAAAAEVEHAFVLRGADGRSWARGTAAGGCVPIGGAPAYVVVDVRRRHGGRTARAAHVHLRRRAPEGRLVVVGVERPE